MPLDYKIPTSDVIRNEMNRLQTEKLKKVREVSAMYLVEIRRLRSLLKIALQSEGKNSAESPALEETSEEPSVSN